MSNNPVITGFSRFAKEGEVISLEVTSDRGQTAWLRLAENLAPKLVAVLQRLLAAPDQRGALTLTVSGSQTSARADGRKAMVLQTQELGPIAFELSEGAIQTLQRQLANLQAIQSSQTSH